MFISKNRLDGDNVELEALRALQYEGTPAEVAQGFKEQGNEVVKMKRWIDGKEFYTKGLAVLAQRKKARLLKPSDGAEEKPSVPEDEAEIGKQRELEEACFVNRALCNLELSMLSKSSSTILQTHSLHLRRKLPIHNPRLRISPPPRCQERQSILPLLSCPLCS